MRRGGTVVLMLALAVALAGPAMAASYKPEYKVSLVVGPTGPWGEAAARFADLVKERSGGKINIKNYFAGQLFAGRQTNEFLLLRQGVADFAWGSTINWSPQVKELNLFSLPFFFPGYEALDSVENGAAGKRIFKIVEEKGVVPLCWGENGFREVTNSKRPVRKPGDMEGLKLRVVGSPIFIDIFKTLGANPVSMNWAEAQTAFQQGTVDGQENPVVSVITPYKLWQSQKYITLWKYAIDPLILGVSKATWDSFGPADQALVRKAGEETCAWQKKGAREGLQGSTAAVDNLAKNGMTVTTLAPKDLEAFKQKTLGVYTKWGQEIGPDLIAEAEREIAKLAKAGKAAKR
ncbi:MAG: DctP family TRAP transporter solute-binding subunit [candidate division NC10 bacterium]|nr:DctP family TRAP transporter solute-binding subunit [candidate division NC10 bacterium]MBI2115310.1 DctP family TRAP transporter solute-binding subunit [candidate division NC10 bacterium]MBI2456989.1 DctP family TRAP transporter solute-binding subunit [candidate division NC10 bacterium]MBI3086639.1 DctP family TRAP transporter solute-binding subunit [candidate division NC10 bacterium]